MKEKKTRPLATSIPNFQCFPRSTACATTKDHQQFKSRNTQVLKVPDYRPVCHEPQTADCRDAKIHPTGDVCGAIVCYFYLGNLFRYSGL